MAGKSTINDGKTMGKPWENTINDGKSLLNGCFNGKFIELNGDVPANHWEVFQ
jgi:hypothetical protein